MVDGITDTVLGGVGLVCGGAMVGVGAATSEFGVGIPVALGGAALISASAVKVGVGATTIGLALTGAAPDKDLKELHHAGGFASDLAFPTSQVFVLSTALAGGSEENMETAAAVGAFVEGGLQTANQAGAFKGLKNPNFASAAPKKGIEIKLENNVTVIHQADGGALAGGEVYAQSPSLPENTLTYIGHGYTAEQAAEAMARGRLFPGRIGGMTSAEFIPIVQRDIAEAAGSVDRIHLGNCNGVQSALPGKVASATGKVVIAYDIETNAGLIGLRRTWPQVHSQKPRYWQDWCSRVSAGY